MENSRYLKNNNIKKHMLELMIQKKMNDRKKNIIKIYGKDMLAEMYLDLLNITEGDVIKKRMLSPLNQKLPKVFKKRKMKKGRWNFDNTITYADNRSFKLDSTSIFNSPVNIKLEESKEEKSNSKRKVVLLFINLSYFVL